MNTGHHPSHWFRAWRAAHLRTERRIHHWAATSSDEASDLGQQALRLEQRLYDLARIALRERNVCYGPKPELKAVHG